MNCIDVHRKLTTEPNNQESAILSHLEECTACANFSKSLKQFEQSLEQAAKVDIPDGLAERILLKQSFKQQNQQRNNRLKLFAIAVSLLLAVGISINTSNIANLLNHNFTLEEAAINHVISEKKHLNDKNNIKLAKLNNVLQLFNIKMNSTIGQINYAGTCPIRNSRGVHIVVQEKNTIATVLFMPGEYIAARKKHSKGEFTTTLIPTPNGSIAIVTDKGTVATIIEDLEKDLKAAIQYI